jgi:hypothetical protein
MGWDEIEIRIRKKCGAVVQLTKYKEISIEKQIKLEYDCCHLTMEKCDATTNF